MEACPTPRPPSAAGREAFSQDQLGKDPPAKSEGPQHRVVKGRGGIFDEVWWARADSEGDFGQSQTRPEDGGFHLSILDVRKSFHNLLYLLHPLQHGCLTVGTWANGGAKEVKPRSI